MTTALRAQMTFLLGLLLIQLLVFHEQARSQSTPAVSPSDNTTGVDNLDDSEDVDYYSIGNEEDLRRSRYDVRIVLADEEPDVAAGEQRASLERRLALVLRTAFGLARSTHLGVRAPATSTDEEAAAQVLEVERRRDIVVVHFVATYAGQPVPAKVVVEDLSGMSLQHISAILQYPVLQVLSQSQVDAEEPRKWVIVAIVIGGAIAILVLGWFLLFLYYNTCGRPYSLNETAPIITPAAFTDKLVQTDEEGDSTQRESTKKRRDRMLSGGRTRTSPPPRPPPSPPPPALVPQSTTDRLQTEDDATGVQPPREPMPRPTELETRELRGPGTSSRTPAPQRSLREEEQITPDNQTEIQSFSTSSSEAPPPPATPVPKTRTLRPKSAGVRRPMRLPDGREVRSFADDDWTIYSAGDKVSTIYGIQPEVRDENPRPILPTRTGVIEITSYNPEVGHGVIRYL